MTLNIKIGVDKMKIKLLTVLTLSSLVLAACQDNAAPNEDVENPDDEIAEVEPEETPEENVDEEIEEVEEVVEFQYQVNPTLYSVEPINLDETTEEKLVLLTYDDAPYGNTLEIAEALTERGVSAIFFVNGMYMEDEEGFEVMQKVHEMGFEIANHTHTHATLPDHSEQDQKEEILKTSEIIEKAIGKKPRFFRAPHGMNTDYSKQLVVDEGMKMMNWSFGYDWMGEYHDAAALTDITLNAPELGNGSNILMHDRTWTAEATPAIVDGLIEQGFTIIDPKLLSHE